MANNKTTPSRRGKCQTVVDVSQDPNHLWRRLYIRAVEFGLEQLHGYRPGGYHPIHLHDELDDGRYRVVNKLGHGGSSTVWLCQDQDAEVSTYVAIKILVASDTTRIDPRLELEEDLHGLKKDEHAYIALRRFKSKSANGTHICLVYPVLGPTIDNAVRLFRNMDNATNLLRSVSRQVVESVAALHARGICHADFRPSNILLELKSLDGLDEDEIESVFGEATITDVHIREDSRPTPEMPYAPRYLIYPAQFDRAEDLLYPPRIKVIDYGQSFHRDRSPQSSNLGIPMNYAAPEVILDGTASVASDLWSLGCTLYEIQCGKRLFDVFQLVARSKYEYVIEIASLIGPPPSQWIEYYESETESEDSDAESAISATTESIASPEDMIYKKMLDHSSDSNCVSQDLQQGFVVDTDNKSLASLLEELLKYQPEERLEARRVLKHTWLTRTPI